MGFPVYLQSLLILFFGYHPLADNAQVKLRALLLLPSHVDQGEQARRRRERERAAQTESEKKVKVNR